MFRRRADLNAYEGAGMTKEISAYLERIDQFAIKAFVFVFDATNTQQYNMAQFLQWS